MHPRLNFTYLAPIILVCKELESVIVFALELLGNTNTVYNRKLPAPILTVEVSHSQKASFAPHPAAQMCYMKADGKPFFCSFFLLLMIIDKVSIISFGFSPCLFGQ